MADKKEAKVRVRAGVLPEVREIRRPDFTKKAADIEKAEAERVLNQGDAASDEAQAAAVAQSLEAQEEAGADGEQLDESAISDVARWYVAHTYSGYENKVREGLIKTVENRHLENQIFEVTVPMQDVYELKNGTKKLIRRPQHQRCDGLCRTGIQAGSAFGSRDEESGHPFGGYED